MSKLSKVCIIDIDIFVIMNSSLTPVHNLFRPPRKPLNDREKECCTLLII